MTTTTNPNEILRPIKAAEADGFAARWAAELKTPTVAPADAREFLGTAPVGTVIEFWDEIYKRRSDGFWAGLETILDGGEFGAAHEDNYFNRMAELAVEYSQPITVLKIGRD